MHGLLNGRRLTARGRRAGVVAATFVVMVVVMLGATVAPAAAHDFWIAPSAFHPRLGSLVGLRLLVGQDMIGDPVPREPSSVERFVVAAVGAGNDVAAAGADAGGRTRVKPVPGRDGGDPAGIFKVEAAGLLVAGYQSQPRALELPPGKFAEYLGEEGLDEIRSIIADPARPPQTARELFVRCAKTLLVSGTSGATEMDVPLGLALELVAERNPYLATAGDRLPFRLTYEGKPRANALVIAINERQPAKRLSARTDKDGRVSFVLPEGGTWLIKAVHMIPAPVGSHADWQSFWASSTFDLPAAGHALPATR